MYTFIDKYQGPFGLCILARIDSGLVMTVIGTLNGLIDTVTIETDKKSWEELTGKRCYVCS